MAQVREQLLQPEVGWKRYDDRDENIEYESILGQFTGSSFYSSTYTEIHNNTSIKFNFTGDKLRIVSYFSSTQSGLHLYIDNNYYGFYDTYRSGATYMPLVFDIQDLPYRGHFVKLIVGGSRTKSILDAIDIDEYGELLPYNEDIVVAKHLIKFSNQIYILSEKKDALVYPNLIEPLTQADYEKWGMDTLIGYENEINKVAYEMNEDRELEEGRVVRKRINKNEWKIRGLGVE